MRGEEWQEGMENEAASVTDARWAREARLAAFWEMFRSVAFGFALAGVLSVLTDPPGSEWGTAHGMPIGCGLVLGWQGKNPLAVAVCCALFVPAAWLTVLLMQWLTPGHAPSQPPLNDWLGLTMPALGFTATHLGALLRRWRDIL